MPKIDLSQPSEQQVRWSLFLGILIWFLHLNTVNALISVSCKWGGLTVPVGGLSGLQILAAILTLITVLALLFLVFLSWRQWRSFQTEKPVQNPDMLRDTEIFWRPLMAFIAMMLDSFLLLYSIAVFVPMLSLKACGQA
jgi:threonine/homoserine/homoserine lactone efflux protein